MRIVLGVVVGFLAWLIAWVGCEKALAAAWPAFGAHQSAFESALKDGGDFAADSAMLLPHLVLGTIVSLMAGFLAALLAGENKRAPLMLGFLLLALGLMKAFLSWAYVPMWYHILFTALLFPMAVLGGRFKK